MNANSMYSPYDFKTTEEREGGKFKGTIVFTQMDDDLRGQEWEYRQFKVYSSAHPEHSYAGGGAIFIPGSMRYRDAWPIVIDKEKYFRESVYALNAVRDKLIAEHEAKDEVCWPDGQPLKTYNADHLRNQVPHQVHRDGKGMRIKYDEYLYSAWYRRLFDKIINQHIRRNDMEEIKVIDGIRHEKVYDFKATSFTENGKWVKGEVQFTWMNEKYRSKPNSSAIDIGIHNNRIVRSSFSPCVGLSSLFIPGESVSSDGNVLRYANKNDFDRDVAALTACQYKPVVEDKPKMLDATLKAIDVYVVEREKEVKRINGVIEQLAGLKEKRPKDICDQFMKVKGRDFYETVVGFPHEASTCPYCIDGHSGGLYCRNDSCGYAKAHGGICDADERSDWHKMRSARKTLLCAIEKAYPFEDKD